MGACSPNTLLVTVGLGGSMAGAFNALAPIPVMGGWERSCTRGSFHNRWSLAIEPLLSL